MSATLLSAEPIYVVGIGVDPYSFPTERPFPQLGLAAVRAALTDAGVAWRDVQAAYVGTASLGMATGRIMLQHLGSHGQSVTQVESASASGSAALRMAALDLSAGASDTALVIGIDKFGKGHRAFDGEGVPRLSPFDGNPAIHFALMAETYLAERGENVEALAAVAVKNHGNAARNPFAQFRKPRTLEQVLASPAVAGALTVQQCCPRGEGAAALVLMTERAVARHRLDRARLVRLRATGATSEVQTERGVDPAIELITRSTAEVLDVAGISPTDLDMVELHDAFSVEELLYTEAMGVCEPGSGARWLRDGHSQIGGTCAVNASGGLIGMGHPLGPTGVGQVAEITRQMRGEAEGRQHPETRLGLAHMIGLGGVAFAHVLEKTGG